MNYRTAAKHINLAILKEYYEKCKTIVPSNFGYADFVRELYSDTKVCGTLACMWGHAPQFYPDIFEYVKTPHSIVVAIKSRDYSWVSRAESKNSLEGYFEPRYQIEVEILHFIFMGNGFHNKELNASENSVHSLEDFTINQALERFSKGIAYLEKFIELKSKE